jgi:hypothetical protein
MTPYADPSEQREYNRNLYWSRYNFDPEFRADEMVRKGKWYHTNSVKILRRIHERQAKKKRKLA